MSDALDDEVDGNFDAFQAMLPGIIDGHRGQYALLRHRRVEGYFTDLGAAFDTALQRFADRMFSVQEVTDRAADLGILQSCRRYADRLISGQPLVPVLIGSTVEPGRIAHEFVALIDTGSTKTCITRTVVEAWRWRLMRGCWWRSRWP